MTNTMSYSQIKYILVPCQNPGSLDIISVNKWIVLCYDISKTTKHIWFSSKKVTRQCVDVFNVFTYS